MNNCYCSPRICYIPGPTGPQGPTGPTGPSGSAIAGLPAYGGIYNASTQLVFFTQVDQFVQVSLNSTLPALNVSYPALSTLVVDIDGVYEINYNVLLNTSTVVDVAIGVRNNGVIIPQTRGSQTLSFDTVAVLSYDGRLSGSTIVTLSAGDTLDLAIAVINILPVNLDAAINGNVNACLTVKKIDEVIVI